MTTKPATLLQHKTNGRAHHRSRRHKEPLDLPEIEQEDPDLDSERLEALLHEFADEPPLDLSEPSSHPFANDETEGHEERRVEGEGRVGGELQDVWTMKAGKSPLLTPAQEIILAKRAEGGDRHAKEELLNANVRLVAAIARKYLGRGLPLEDLMQEGLLGLLRAIEKYNYRKGYRFSTYATFWVRQAITRAIANQGRSIRLPAHVVDTLGRIARLRESLRHRLGRAPTRGELAEAAGMSEKKLGQLLGSAASAVSLETPVGEEGESVLGEFVGVEGVETPSERVFRWLVREELEAALGVLTPRERAVLELRYGLGEVGEAHTLEETGRRLHITRERARQIEAKALEKMRRPHPAEKLKEAIG